MTTIKQLELFVYKDYGGLMLDKEPDNFTTVKSVKIL